MWIGDFRFLALLGMTRWWDCFVVAPHTLPLWIADQVRNDGLVVDLSCLPLSPCRSVDTALKPVRRTPAAAPHLWIADQVRNDGLVVGCVVLFTLTFDSSPIKGEGDMVGVVLLLPRPVDTALKPV